MNALLELKNLRIAYGGINAVKGISLVVNEGELTTLIGANGAGKTSTLKAIAGMIHSASGDVVYAGENIANQPSYAIARKGLALVPEGRGVFPQLTVEENLSMGAYARNDHAEIKLDVEKIFTMFARLKERRAQTAGTLSGGEQQMLAIGRALMSRPKLLLLDEPSMGLAPLMVQKIFEVIRTVSASGVTILLVEQNAKLALEASTRGYVMDGGEITLTDDAKALLTNPKVREAYLGES
jgi:branched-chain amino acid transport system ATP-binding protein